MGPGRGGHPILQEASGIRRGVQGEMGSLRWGRENVVFDGDGASSRRRVLFLCCSTTTSLSLSFSYSIPLPFLHLFLDHSSLILLTRIVEKGYLFSLSFGLGFPPLLSFLSRLSARLFFIVRLEQLVCLFYRINSCESARSSPAHQPIITYANIYTDSIHTDRKYAYLDFTRTMRPPICCCGGRTSPCP